MKTQLFTLLAICAFLFAGNLMAGTKYRTVEHVATTLNFAADGGDKVEICHNGNTIEVSVNALDAHLAHGDTRGYCGCVGPAIPGPCILLYRPVCGCDGVQYGNSCFAFRNGVTSWTNGPCS